MDITQARIDRLIVHRVGNKARDEALFLTEADSALDTDAAVMILHGYLKGIVAERRKYRFRHDSDINLNEVFHYSRQFFGGQCDFIELSQRVARHLYSKTQHPNIGAGDLFVILFADLDGPGSRAIGIFKSEVREEFLTLDESGGSFKLGHASGINPKMIDKGALLLESDNLVYALDRAGRETKYWQEDFLQAERLPDPASSGRMMAQILESLAQDIEDPLSQLKFKENLRTLCDSTPELSTSQVTALADDYLAPQHIAATVSEAADRSGFALDREARLPSEGLYKRIERSLNKSTLGHGISLLLPSQFSLQHIHSLDQGEDGMVLTLTLKRRE
ncbi:nucleoid-associated protein [Paludibacterium yongneupense]|uniref:nucleoid-associated protein n=1 Tax=Paludibacterium yongneupense TaxID=400061 RepID=UPI00041635A1|nr:nucleoid-associated protein [Paludibacterium yongneupense]